METLAVYPVSFFFSFFKSYAVGCYPVEVYRIELLNEHLLFLFALYFSYNTIYQNYTRFVTRGEKMQKRAFVSFSGGKDSNLSLLKAQEAGFTVCALLSMVRADGQCSASHHLPVSVLQQQGESLGIPLLVRSTSWEEYERNFLECLSLLKEQRIEYGIFGDIDVIEHRQWVERVCGIGEMKSFLPLWGYDHLEIAREFVRRSFEAFVVVVKDQLLPLSFVGRKYDEALIDELLALGVDPCGENGEFHTLVVNGPLYQRPLSYHFGEVFSDQGYHFVRIDRHAV